MHYVHKENKVLLQRTTKATKKTFLTRHHGSAINSRPTSFFISYQLDPVFAKTSHHQHIWRLLFFLFLSSRHQINLAMIYLLAAGASVVSTHVRVMRDCLAPIQSAVVPLSPDCYATAQRDRAGPENRFWIQDLTDLRRAILSLHALFDCDQHLAFWFQLISHSGERCFLWVTHCTQHKKIISDPLTQHTRKNGGLLFRVLYVLLHGRNRKS